MKVHLEALHQGAKYKCDICAYQTSWKIALSRHKKSVDEGIKFRCDECDYQFTQKPHLTRHQESLHRDRKYDVLTVIASSHRKVMLQNIAKHYTWVLNISVLTGNPGYTERKVNKTVGNILQRKMM